MAHVLIVAPNGELSRSLQFVLEAEGHLATTRDGFEDPRGFPEDADCTVIDHHAAHGNLQAALDFVQRHEPVILLSNAPDHPLAAHCFRTVTKPFLGPFLLQALWHAIRSKKVEAR
jgi:CheY-like chemotaxis protein